LPQGIVSSLETLVQRVAPPASEEHPSAHENRIEMRVTGTNYSAITADGFRPQFFTCSLLHCPI
jgi:hypothetical protein